MIIKTMTTNIFLLTIGLVIFWLVNFLPAISHAAIKERAVLIHGTLTAIKDDIVIVRTQSGGHARIPTRALSPDDRRNLQLGRQVQAKLTFTELVQLNKATSKK